MLHLLSKNTFTRDITFEIAKCERCVTIGFDQWCIKPIVFDCELKYFIVQSQTRSISKFNSETSVEILIGMFIHELMYNAKALNLIGM